MMVDSFGDVCIVVDGRVDLPQEAWEVYLLFTEDVEMFCR